MTDTELRFIMSAQDAGLKRAFESAEQAVGGLDEQLRRLPAANAKVASGLKTNNQIYYQAGQAISDFSVAGVRGAANNIEFLASQLGAGGPLLIGISLATAAFAVFGEDIVRALNPVGERVKELKQGFDEVLKVVETSPVNLLLFEQQIPAALAEAEGAVKSLNDQIQDLIGANSGTPELAYLNRDKIRAARLELAEATTNLEAIQAKRDEFNLRDDQAATARRLSIVQENELLDETLRKGLEKIGLGKELQSIEAGKLAQLTYQGTLEEFILSLQKQGAKEEKAKLTETERLAERNKELSDILGGIRSGERDRTEELRIQNIELDKQVRQAQKILELRTAAGGSITSDLAIQGLQRAAISDTQSSPGLFDTKALFDRLDPNLVGADALDDGARLALDNMERMKESVRGLIDLNTQLTASLQGGLADGFTTLADAIGKAAISTEGFQGFGTTILSSLGSFAQQFGATLVAFGTSGVALQSFVTNPVGALIAGGALVALGATLKGTAQRQLDQFSQGAGSGSVPASSVTALGFNRPVNSIARGAALGREMNAMAGMAERPIRIVVEAENGFTPSGDFIRGIRAGLVTESKKGGKGRL